MKASKTKRILVYGPPKTGKTLLVGKLAAKFKLDWFDLEHGKDTLFQLPAEQQNNINIFDIPDTRSTPMAIETCLKVIKGAPVEICHLHGKVACPLCKKLPDYAVKHDSIALKEARPDRVLVFDSLTQLTNSAIANITRGTPDDYKLKQDDWGNLGKIMDMFLSHIQAANYNVICISHETAVELQDGKERIVPTAGTRNFSRNTAKYFDEVIYCEVENKKHKFSSSSTAKNSVVTGSRGGIVLEGKAEVSLLDLWG